MKQPTMQMSQPQFHSAAQGRDLQTKERVSVAAADSPLVSEPAVQLALFPEADTAGVLEAPEDQHLAAAGRKLSLPAFLALSWSSIGVIFGDIATSPLYVFVNVFQDLQTTGPLRKSDVLGATSLVFWTLTLVVLVKYIGVVLRADDQGQGGTFALYSLLCRNMGIKPHGCRGPHVPGSHRVGGAKAGEGGVGGCVPGKEAAWSTPSPGGGPFTESVDVDYVQADSDKTESRNGVGAAAPAWWQHGAVDKRKVHSWFRRNRRAQVALWGVSVVATAMLIGDGVLTPAISVLSAVSGLRVAVPSLSQDVVVVVTIVVLCLIFALQKLGTGQVGRYFAPIIALWLFSNAAINVYNITLHGGGVFAALNPVYIGFYFARHGVTAWRSLGAVMLCVTGAEALFADLGHFSRESISVAFGLLAYPCLVVTYLGQAAHVIAYPEDTDAFWASLPSKLLYPMLVLATLATIVASQALISGVFSIIRQAMILGAFPPVRVVHTGGKNIAAATQVYVPLANAVLFLLCCAVVGGFRDTVALGKAYGLAVMTDMMTTTCLISLVMVAVWGVSLLLLFPFMVLFLVVEGTYWTSNIIKVPEGGWFTLAIALGVSVIMLIWWAGSRRLGERLAAITEGASIEILNAPQPPPLLLRPPLPRPPPLKPALGARSLLRRLGSSFGSQTTTNKRVGSISVASAPLPSTQTSFTQPSSVPSFRQSVRFAARPQCTGEQSVAAAPAGPVDAMAAPSRDQAYGPSIAASGSCSATTTAKPWWPDAGVASLHGRGQVPESYFAPGTLALVIPLDSPAASPAAAADSTLSNEVGTTLCQGSVPASNAAQSHLPAAPLRRLRDEEAVTPECRDGGSQESPPPPASAIIPLNVRLAGIGVYYMDEKVGGANGGLTALPPVLVHFLRNVQAIHGVCIFLSVRRLPIPTIPRRHRLRIYTPHSATPPNFYQVVARYGYLDLINHGSAFMSELLDAILKRLVAAVAALEGQVSTVALAQLATRGEGGDARSHHFPQYNHHRDATDDGTARATSVLTSQLPTISFSTSRGHGAPPGEGDSSSAATEKQCAPWTIGRDDHEGGESQGSPSTRALARRGQHSHAVLLRRPTTTTATQPVCKLGGELELEISPSLAAADSEGHEISTMREDGGGGSRRGVGPYATPSIAARSWIEEAVATFLEARVQGVVYYASRALIRATKPTGSPLTQFIQWLVYGLIYRWLAAVSYVDMERWHVPTEKLVELGMQVDIG